jgi:hypothetical protein
MKINNFIKFISILIFGILCFSGGFLLQKHKLLESEIYELREPLVLQASPDHEGLLPKGTVLYHYSSGPSTDTYVVFVNSKSLNVLKPISFENWLTVSPIDGYQK